jgi:hypothetical protein
VPEKIINKYQLQRELGETFLIVIKVWVRPVFSEVFRRGNPK